MINNSYVCLSCNITINFQYDPNTRSCICQTEYLFKNGLCVEVCGDGIITSTEVCDDGNRNNGDGCSSLCMTEVNFNCLSVSNGPTFTSKCAYILNIYIKILSEIKMTG